ncbi:MAG: magnesium transporter [Clostridiales bacterium]|nr:magnesium transporter [Clostridiales bacterium]
MKEVILELMDENRYKDIKEKISEMNIVDIAELLMELDKTKLLILFRILPKEMAADVFSYVSLELQQYIIESITDKEIGNIVNDLFLDDAVDFLEEMPSNVVKKVLRNADEETRKLINQFFKYPEYSAGSVMTIEFVDLKKQMTIKEALEHIRATGVDKETINTCYVTDSRRKLEGVISIRKIILADENAVVGDIMNEDVICAHTLDDQETVADLFKKYDLTVLPVVDNEHRLVGIVTIDDIVDIIEQENTEDLHKMAAMQPLEEEYLKTSPIVLAKHRIVWLLVLMISATFAGNIIKKYNELLQSVVVLTAFIPMIMDTGGNAGSQASTLIIRGMALGEIKTSDALKVFIKEIQVSLIAGFILALVNFARLVFLEHIDIMIAAMVCFSLLLTVIIAKMIGSTLPIAAKKMRLDPAIMAGPLITTIVDALALSIYFMIASKFLNI